MRPAGRPGKAPRARTRTSREQATNKPRAMASGSSTVTLEAALVQLVTGFQHSRVSQLTEVTTAVRSIVTC